MQDLHESAGSTKMLPLRRRRFRRRRKHAPRSRAQIPTVLLKHLEFPILQLETLEIGPSLALDVCLRIKFLRLHTRVLGWGASFGRARQSSYALVVRYGLSGLKVSSKDYPPNCWFVRFHSVQFAICSVQELIPLVTC